MPLIRAHEDKSEVTGLTKDGNYHTTDLSSYVSEGCVGILLQFVNNHTTTSKTAGYKTVGSSTDRDITLAAKSHQLVLCKLDGSYQAQIKCADSNVSVYIQTEFFEGVVLQNSDDWPVKSEWLTGWITVTVEPLGDDTYEDIEAALVYGAMFGGQQAFGARPLGATTETQSLIQNQIFALPVKTNSNGQYQIYIPSAGCGPPTVHAKEIGYIKKGYGFTAVFEVEDLAPATNSDWENLDLGEEVEKYSTHAAIRLVMSAVAATDTCGVRAKGSSNPADTLSNGIWVVYWPKVNFKKLIEYRYQGDQEVVFDVWGYVSGVSEDSKIIDINTGEVTITTGEINIG